MKMSNLFKFGVMSLAVLTMAAACGDDGGDGPTPPAGDVKVTGVTVAPTSKTLAIGETVTLTATVAPSDATNKAVTWSTSAAAVATVANGVVTAVAEGTATITVTTTDGNKTATCAITVEEGGTPPPPPPPTATITIDGTFDDWANAPAGSVTTYTVDEATALSPDLKVLKVTASELFLNVYYEFDKECLNACATNTNLNFYIDIDGGDTATWYNNATISNSYFDYILQGSITNWTDTSTGAEPDPTIISINLNTYKCPESGLWPDWQADNIGSGYSSGAGLIDGDVIKYEYQIMREALPMDLPSTIYVMFDCQRNDTTSGVLPMNGDGSGVDGEGLAIPTGKTFAWVIGE